MSDLYKFLSRYSYNSAIRKAFRLPLNVLTKFFEIQLPIWGGPLKGKAWILNSSDYGCWLGSARIHLQDILKKTLMEGGVFFDLGAHVGYLTMLAAKLVGPTGKIFAFEPLPRNLYFLRKHLEINRINNVSIIEAGVSDIAGTAYIELPNSRNHLAAYLSPDSDKGLQILTVSIDDLIAKAKLPIPDCIKINIEGSEFMALKGAEKLLRKAHPVLLISTHGGVVHHQCYNLLNTLGYHIDITDEVSGHFAELHAY